MTTIKKKQDNFINNFTKINLFGFLCGQSPWGISNLPHWRSKFHTMQGNFERHISLLITFHTIIQIIIQLGEMANTYAIIH